MTATGHSTGAPAASSSSERHNSTDHGTTERPLYRGPQNGQSETPEALAERYFEMLTSGELSQSSHDLAAFLELASSSSANRDPDPGIEAFADRLDTLLAARDASRPVDRTESGAGATAFVADEQRNNTTTPKEFAARAFRALEGVSPVDFALTIGDLIRTYPHVANGGHVATSSVRAFAGELYRFVHEYLEPNAKAVRRGNQIFSIIGGLAYNARALTILAIEQGDAHTESIIIALRALNEKVGYLSDVGASLCGNGGIYGSYDEWIGVEEEDSAPVGDAS